jgi:hypothetical protein
MQRRSFGLGGSSALSWSLGLAVVAACSVYDSSLLTGGSEGQGGTSSAGEGPGGESGTSTGGSSGDSGATTGGGTGGKGGSSGTGTGGAKGGSAGDTGGTGGTDPTGGDAGEPPTGGTAGAGTGSGGSAGSSGAAGSGTSGGSGGSAGDAGSGGACGKCGCGKAETGDTDGDGVLDCNDTCEDLNDADCDVLRSGLVHRYSFNGTGTAVMDTKGTAHGTATGVNAALSGNGTIVLTGGSSTQTNDPNKQYVDLPDNLLSGLTNATFETWVTWPATGNNWQRIFDFGNAATGSTGAYVFLTPRVSSTGGCRVALSTAGSASETAAGGAQVNGPVIAAGAHHFVFIIDDTGDSVSLYVDGTLGSTVGFTGSIASLAGPNNWLGRSNYTTSADPYLGGTLDEFRIYNVALTPAQLRTSRSAGPNATLF